MLSENESISKTTMFPIRWLCLTILVSPLSILTSSAEQINCRYPQIFSVETEIDNQIYVYDAEIRVKYNRSELAVYEYPVTNDVNILLNDTVVSFSGHIVYDNDVFDATALKTLKVLNTKIAGSAQLVNSSENEKLLSNCSLYLAKTPQANIGLPRQLEIEILHRAASCIRPLLCSKLGSITLRDFRNAERHIFDFGVLSVIPKQIRDYIFPRRPELTSELENSLQSVINIIVDVVIAEIVETIKLNKEGTIEIPDITLNVTEHSSWKPDGKLEAQKGTFSDLTTLTRTKDATLSHDGLRFTASCGFGFSQAKINYEKYKLTYGLSVSGRISATIDGLSLATSIVLDLQRKPCRIILQELRVEKLGTVKIKMTGLGPFNNLLSKFATWITKKWKEEIVVTVETKMREVVEEYLSKFNCEKLRP